MILLRRKAMILFLGFLVFVLCLSVGKFFQLSEPSGMSGAPRTKEIRSRLNGEVRVRPGDNVETPFEESVESEIRNHVKERKVTFITEEGETREFTAGTKASATKGVEESKALDLKSPDDEKIPEMSADGVRYIPRRRVVHFDFKGAPPKLSYLKAIFPLIKAAGATHVLIEYEDMFPFTGTIANISAANAYSKTQIQTLLGYAKSNSLEVIPLIQTFGHLEMALKLDEFKDLREDPYSPQSICPSNDKSWDLVTDIINQVADMHPDSTWLHIGCDEVYQLGQCPICTERLTKWNEMGAGNSASRIYGRDVKSLFLDHVARLAKYVRAKKKKIPIIWDDLLRTVPAPVLLESGVGQLVEPMVWVYIEEIDRFIDSLTWQTFSRVFPNVWTAGAYKGAFGEMLYQTNLQRHVGNNLSWLEVMRRESVSAKAGAAEGPFVPIDDTENTKNVMSFRGLVLTGWSRYDHFAILCELLPVAIPSLILNLAVIADGGHTTQAVKNTHRILKCGTGKEKMTPDELSRDPQQQDLHRCRFPGSGLFSLTTTFDMTKKETEDVYDKLSRENGWMTDYHVRHDFGSPTRIYEKMRSVNYLPNSLKSLRKQLEENMEQYFDHFTIDEWLEQRMQPLQEMADQLIDRMRKLTSATVWARRPLISQNYETKHDKI